MRTLLIALCLLLVTGPVLAAGCAAPINARQSAQQARIGAGIAQGDLRPGETWRLQARQAHIHQVEQRYRHNDGVLGPLERCDLNRRLNGASRGISVQRHDRQRRW
ncbi:MAG: hypothetical protein KDI56_12315 [Xanthomonadales bacterium]|nr:hypothetical protein [Xanthomonadales bacterium]